ncbi:MAG TPA: MFS transporter [Chthoniobacterales bacterium]|jgi:MFS family permease|nr:MFS transporter [Chthoniobacterales bacterium]
MTRDSHAKAGAYGALALLLGINLFNYIDRQVLAAVEPEIRATFFAPNDPNAMTSTGLLGDAFLVTYMISAPLLGWLSDRFSRWIIIGCALVLWSLASGATGLAGSFAILFGTRVLVGIGEGGYGPAGPTILADLFSLEQRGRVMAIFCAAIPVGSALGYVLGGQIGARYGWRWAFYLVVVPGLLLALLCFFQRDPARSRERRQAARRIPIREYLALFRIRSFTLNTLAQATMTFAVAGLGFWIAEYLHFRGQPAASGTTIFGGVTVVAGFGSTLIGGWLADKWRPRFPSADFLVSGAGMILACPIFIMSLYLPFPSAWIAMFFAIFFLFLNTGPSNTAIANVSQPAVRAMAFALNIFVIHMLGDLLAFPSIGFVGGHSNIRVAFLFVTGVMFLSGVIWLVGMKFLPNDSAAVEETVLA